MTEERNDLAEQLRHGIAVSEKEEYAKEIQRLTKVGLICFYLSSMLVL